LGQLNPEQYQEDRIGSTISSSFYMLGLQANLKHAASGAATTLGCFAVMMSQK